MGDTKYWILGANKLKMKIKNIVKSGPCFNNVTRYNTHALHGLIIFFIINFNYNTLKIILIVIKN